MKYRVHTHLRSVLMLVGIACAGILDNSQACNVPVFRYAMERWPADSYQILVYHRASPRGAAFELLQKGSAERDGAANYYLENVDVSRSEGKALAERRGVPAYPWVEVYYPLQYQVRTPVWSGLLTLDNARIVLGSPGRSRLAEALLGGDVAVWVLIKSGDDQKDRRARDSLESQLAWASETLQIPETGVDVDGNPVEVTDFKTHPVRFSLMEVAHDDPDEALLVGALLNSEPDLGGYDEPMVFLIFGRGRTLYALVGAGIQKSNIREACESILGWCSCEIKDQNPGTDLLVSADWSQPFGGRMVDDPEMPLTGLSGFLQDPEPVEPAVPSSAPKPTEPVPSVQAAREVGDSSTVPVVPPLEVPGPGESPVVRNVLYLGGAAGLVLLALSLLVGMKARR